jgi:hypothetical protein
VQIFFIFIQFHFSVYLKHTHWIFQRYKHIHGTTVSIVHTLYNVVDREASGWRKRGHTLCVVYLCDHGLNKNSFLKHEPLKFRSDINIWRFCESWIKRLWKITQKIKKCGPKLLKFTKNFDIRFLCMCANNQINSKSPTKTMEKAGKGIDYKFHSYHSQMPIIL